MKRTQALGRSLRTVGGMLALGTLILIPAGRAHAISYASGDVWYVAYQSPTGPNYIVNLGSKDQFVNATTTISFPDVLASDLNGVVGASAANIWVSLFGVLNPTTRDGILAGNGPLTDTDLSTANIIGATNQIDSFGGGVVNNALAVPSANVHAGKFASSGSIGSYQSTLNAINKGSLGNNIQWDVETRLSDASGVRNAAAVMIPVYKAIRNPFVGLLSRQVIGFFTLNPSGTLTYSPDLDGDLIADEVDLCPGINNSGDNSDTDGDHHAPACDCNLGNGAVWSIPTEVVSMTFSNSTSFSWSAPADPGGTSPLYDVIQAVHTSSAGTAPSYGCFQPNLAGLTSTDASVPAVSSSLFYLIRAGNACGEGTGGAGSSGVPRTLPTCP